MNVQFHFDELLDEIDGLVDSQYKRVDAEVSLDRKSVV